MTKTEFKKAMMRGLGRCVMELDDNNDIEKYRDIILWGCLHNLSYDTQCEGTRSEYMYVLQSKFEDDYFEPKIIDMFMKENMDSWLFNHLANMLYLFACDGSEKSYHALYNKYDNMINGLTVSKGYLKLSGLKDQFEWLCIWLVSLDGMATFKRIVSDIGGAYGKNPNLVESCTFDWFYAASKNNFGKKRITNYMEKGIEKSEEIRLFYEAISTGDNKSNNTISEKITVKDVVQASNDEWYKCRGKIVRFSYKASDKELIELANIMVEETQEQMKANLLWAFHKRGFPLEIDIIIDYTKSENIKLAQNAFEILAITKNVIVREYALELIKNEKYLEEALSMLFNNYQAKDKELVFSLLKRIKVNYRDGLWHGVYSNAISWMENDRKVSENIILYLYENTLCSCCREYIVRVMSKRGMLTGELLKECLYDSKEEIRKFAELKSRRVNK